MKPQFGDLVRLTPQRITRQDGLYVYLGGTDVLIYERDIEEILPRPIGVGNRVIHVPTGVTGTVLAIDGDDAWIRADTKTAMSVKGKNLEHLAGGNGR